MPKVKAIFFGPGGSGKTSLAASWANEPNYGGPALMLNLMGNPEEVLAEGHPDLWVVDIEQLKDFDTVFTFLANGQKDNRFREAAAIPGDVMFKTVIIDTFTEAQRMIITQESGLTDTSPVTAAGKIDIQTWGKIQNRTLRLSRSYIDHLDMNVIFTLYEKSYITLDAGSATASERRPCLDGSSGEIVPGYVPLVGRIVMGWVDDPDNQGKKMMAPIVTWRSTTGESWTKNQLSKALGGGMKNPSAHKIYEVLETVYGKEQ
jgi:hypothetical protein